MAGSITSMKNSNDTIRNRTRDLPACSAVPQPTAPHHAPSIPYIAVKIVVILAHVMLEMLNLPLVELMRDCTIIVAMTFLFVAHE